MEKEARCRRISPAARLCTTKLLVGRSFQLGLRFVIGDGQRSTTPSASMAVEMNPDTRVRAGRRDGHGRKRLIRVQIRR